MRFCYLETQIENGILFLRYYYANAGLCLLLLLRILKGYRGKYVIYVNGNSKFSK